MSDDTPRPSLLPANSSALERALDLGFGKLLDRIAPPFPELMNPGQTPAAFLSYLASDRGVSEWDTDASESEKRVTVSLSWQIQRLAGTQKALGYAVESLGFTPTFIAWHQQRPLGTPYTFDVQAIIGSNWSSGDHNRLIHRVNAAKCERDESTITIVHKTRGDLGVAAAVDPGLSIHDDSQPGALPTVALRSSVAVSGVVNSPLSDSELTLGAALPEVVLRAGLISAGVSQRYTINDYDLGAQL